MHTTYVDSSATEGMVKDDLIISKDEIPISSLLGTADADTVRANSQDRCEVRYSSGSEAGKLICVLQVPNVTHKSVFVSSLYGNGHTVLFPVFNEWLKGRRRWTVLENVPVSYMLLSQSNTEWPISGCARETPQHAGCTACNTCIRLPWHHKANSPMPTARNMDRMKRSIFAGCSPPFQVEWEICERRIIIIWGHDLKQWFISVLPWRMICG